jgi:hypothetical protein
MVVRSPVNAQWRTRPAARPITAIRRQESDPYWKRSTVLQHATEEAVRGLEATLRVTGSVTSNAVAVGTRA